MNILNLIQKAKYNIFMGIIFAFLVVLPDYIFQFNFAHIHYLTDAVFIAVLALFGFFLSMTGVLWYIFFCIIFMVMQLIQLGHIAYFSRPINPLDIGKVFTEFNDVYTTSVTDIDDFWFVPLLAILPFLIMIILKFKWRKKLYISYIGLIAVIIFLAVKPERATRRGLQHFLPPETRYSMHNSINSFSYFLVHGTDKENLSDIVPADFYKDDVVTKHNPTADLIVLVIGESTSAEKMHLFNNKASLNTPQLEKFLSDEDFMARPAISGGVSTHASLPIFFNLVKEPGNIRKLTSYNTNLFKMAKENGYNTYFYSAYDMKQTNLIGVPFIDKIITKESNRRRFNAEKEDYLLELFKEIDLHNGKNFVVLNFRSTHSPYEENYAHRPEFDVFKPQNDSRFAEENAAYDNAILYIDDILAQIIKHIKNQNIENAHFLFTSDHGEMLGYPDNQYGHNQLIKEVYSVPFVWLGVKPDNFRNRKIWFQYEIAKFVAELLGYKVQNQNFDENTMFVHGNNLFEDYEFVRITRTNNDNISETPRQTVSRFVKKSNK